MLRAFLAAALLSLAAVPLAVPSAHAEDGVTVDDSSPAAKEYAIPLDEARSDAAGGSSRSGSDGAPEPFGQGVTVPDRSSSSSSSKPARKSAKKDRTSTKVRTTTAPSSSVSADAEPTRTVAAAPAGGDSGSGSSSGQALAGGAALVILAGGAAGLWARRRQPAGEPG